jgi:hypothetical protein
MTEKAVRPPAADSPDVLDETDPHAGDDFDWTDDSSPAAAGDPQPLLFWKGLAAGLVLSLAAWGLLTAVAYTIFELLS